MSFFKKLIIVNLIFICFCQPVFLRDMLPPTEGTPSADSAGESDSATFRFTVEDANRKLLLTSSSSTERGLWMRHLEEARKSCLQTERVVLQRQRSSKVFVFYVGYVGKLIEHRRFHRNNQLVREAPIL